MGHFVSTIPDRQRYGRTSTAMTTIASNPGVPYLQGCYKNRSTAAATQQRYRKAGAGLVKSTVRLLTPDHPSYTEERPFAVFLVWVGPPKASE